MGKTNRLLEPHFEREICAAFQAGYTFVTVPESPSLHDCESGYERTALRAAFSVILYCCEELTGQLCTKMEA